MDVSLSSKKASDACKEKRKKLLYNFIQFYVILKMLPVCFRFLCLVKFCSGCFRQVFFSFRRQKKWLLVALGRWSSWTFAWADSALVVLDEWSSYRGGRLNRFDCIC